MRSGIQRARIEDITHASGLSKGAFYLHFASKEALFRLLVDELKARLEDLRLARVRGWSDLMSRGVPGDEDPGPFVAEALALEGAGDRKLLTLLWDWRDVTDVLLRGSQGTEFDRVMWAILDREAARIEAQCEAMARAGLMRVDVPGAVLGSMIVGTWLMLARRMPTLAEKPDFEPWVRALQSVIADGASSGTLRAHRDAAARKLARPRGVVSTRTPSRRTLAPPHKDPS